MSVDSRDILAGFDGLAHTTVNGLPVRTTEHRTGTQQGEGVVFGTSIIDSNVPQHIFADLLSQVDVDAQEIS